VRPTAEASEPWVWWDARVADIKSNVGATREMPRTSRRRGPPYACCQRVKWRLWVGMMTADIAR
jgi:hypothetical protein